jgi:DNA-binding NarL/FixJ family response regulator
MTERIDYDKVAEKVNYPALDKKLDELSKKAPPPRRKKAADVLAPVTPKLLAMHAEGWTYQQLAEELKSSGLTVTTSALRAHLSQARKGRKTKARPTSKG